MANVKLDYSVNSGSAYPNVITASVANSSPYAWTVPDSIGATRRVKIYPWAISDANGVAAL